MSATRPSVRQRFGTLLRGVRRRLLVGSTILWTLITAPLAVFMVLSTGRWWVLAALVAGPLAMVLRRRPYLAAAVLIGGATVLRLAFLGLTASDPIAVSQAAGRAALAGQNPYALHYADGLSYPYGPLGLITYQAGIPGELLATIGTSVLLAWGGAWMTLALFNAWPQFIYMPVIGNNDFSVGFLTLAALLLVPRRPAVAMALLAAAVAIKPYAAAWALPAAVYAGLVPSLAGLGVSVLLWAPVLLLWGVPSFARATLEAEQVRASLPQVPSWSFADAPLLRWLAVPISFVAFFVRSWRGMALTGSVVFVVFLGFAPRAPQPYLGFLLPILGLALEWRRPNDHRPYAIGLPHGGASSGDVQRSATATPQAIRPATRK